MMKSSRAWLLAVVMLAASALAQADEGMWLFNDVPAAKIAATYGFTPSAAWLDHLRLSSLRVAGGCSASVVSANGLVLTNHHCVRSCIESISGLTHKDYNRDGFLAATLADEPRCAGMELNQLVEISDVTPKVLAATRDLPPARFAEAQRIAITAIERACAVADEWRCEVVSLWRGGRYDLYRYRRFQEIRLVFVPEDAAADFGGDLDNFNFPRYALDAAFVRIVDREGRPMAMADHLTWSAGTVREGDAVFVTGQPGRTSRGYTLAQIDDDRDWELPAQMNRASEFLGFITEYQQRGDEQRRHASNYALGYSNYLKGMKGRHAALAEPAFHAQLVRNEASLRAAVAARPELQQAYGEVWTRIAALVARARQLLPEYQALNFNVTSGLYNHARTLSRYAEESGKPDGERLREYTQARMAQLRAGLLADSPVYPELEIATLSWSLGRLREDLGPDHPAVKRILGRRSPREVAITAVQGSSLQSPAQRQALLDGGAAAIRASQDPMLVLARAIDADALPVRRTYETEVEGPMTQQQELLARARFAVAGRDGYPDATFSLRLSYGAIRGFAEKGVTVPPFTTFGGAFERDTGAEPFALPPSWLAAKPRLRLEVPLDLIADTDVIGGNSGSPMVNRAGELVGLVFDGNSHSLGGAYGFDPALNRTIAVHSAAIVQSLARIYGAARLVDELQAGRTLGAAPK